MPIEEGTRPSGDEALEEMSETQGTAPWTGFEQELSRFHERSLRQEEIIRLMQARITELQGDQVQALLRPMLRRIAGLHAQAAEARDGAAARGEKAVNDFSYYMVAIEEALGMVDLDSVEARAGDAFAPETQHAASALPTGDPVLSTGPSNGSSLRASSTPIRTAQQSRHRSPFIGTTRNSETPQQGRARRRTTPKAPTRLRLPPHKTKTT